ncbi:site-specific integrase, partial [bacterium]|nr:site-specific integrase [bacterium]
MPKPFKPTRPFRLPAGAEVVTHDGKPHVRLRERGKAVLYPLTRDGAKYLRPAKRWYFDLRDEAGTMRRVKGFADLKAAEQLAAEMERKASRVRSGYADPAEEHARRPLADHLTDYAAQLEAKGNTPEHTALTTGRVTALLSGCGFVFPLDADAARAADWLIALRRDGSPAALPPGDSFAPREVAKLLGISGAAVHATGFFRWLVKAKRIGSNPLDSLSLVNSAVDVRRARRELTATELGRLFNAARSIARAYRGLSGADRYFLYLVAAGTGFRASALSNLTPDDFDLDVGTVTLAARFNKSRRLKVQPLPADVAAALRPYFEGKPTGVPIWGGTWARDHRGAEMLRIDLDAAGIAYATDGPDGPEYADFHALRHSYLTLGGRFGIDLRTLQELAGHSKPELTARYSHRRLYDLAGAVEKLPTLVPTAGPNTTAGSMPLRMTGTDGLR